MGTNKLIHLPDEVKRSIEQRVNGLLLKVVNNALDVDINKRATFMTNSFGKLLEEEISMLTFDNLELKKDIEQLKKQIK